MAHNASPQTGVVPNPDPALNPAHEHEHAHLHHGGPAAKQEKDVVYTTGTTDEPSIIPHQDKMDNQLNRHQLAGDHGSDDMEKGYNEKTGMKFNERGATSPHSHDEEEDPKNHSFSNFYRKYRIFFHGFFAAVVTGWWTASLVLHVVSTIAHKVYNIRS